jgi:hypothetical protein
MVFKKKALKPKKIRAVRQPRAKASKEQHTHIINVFNTPHGTHNPYVSDMPFQDSYKVPYVFSTQRFSVPQTLEPQMITRNVEEKATELTAKNVFQPTFQVPVGLPKSKITIGEQMHNPYMSESEGSPRNYSSGAEKSPRSDKGKARGSYKEKQIVEGRNIQNLFALGASSGGESGGGQPVFVSSKMGI